MVTQAEKLIQWPSEISLEKKKRRQLKRNSKQEKREENEAKIAREKRTLLTE